MPALVFQHDVHHLVFAGLFFGDHDFAFAMEHPADGAGFRHVAAVFAHEVAEFANDAIAIGRDHLDQHANAARAVAFEGGFLILLALELAGAAQNSALDVFIGHVFIFTCEDGGAEARI